MTDPLLDRVAAQARKHAHKRHSPAYRWLRGHHAELAPIFAAQQPPWREIAAELTAGACGAARARRSQGAPWRASGGGSARTWPRRRPSGKQPSRRPVCSRPACPPTGGLRPRSQRHPGRRHPLPPTSRTKRTATATPACPSKRGRRWRTWTVRCASTTTASGGGTGREADPGEC